MIVRADHLTDAEFKGAYARAASFWGRQPDTDPAWELTKEMLHAQFSKPPTDAAFHYTPSSFFLEEDFSFLPIRWDTPWYGLEKTLEVLRPKAIVSVLPVMLQLDAFLLASFAKTHVPTMPTVPGNTPLVLELLKQLGADTIVATRNSAQAFLLQATPVQVVGVRVWHIVTGPEEADRISFPGTVVKDLHVLPGVSVAWQCPELCAGRGNAFHPSPSFAWHVDDGVVRISSLDERPCPLYRFKVARGELTKHACACEESLRLDIYGA